MRSQTQTLPLSAGAKHTVNDIIWFDDHWFLSVTSLWQDLESFGVHRIFTRNAADDPWVTCASEPFKIPHGTDDEFDSGKFTVISTADGDELLTTFSFPDTTTLYRYHDLAFEVVDSDPDLVCRNVKTHLAYANGRYYAVGPADGDLLTDTGLYVSDRLSKQSWRVVRPPKGEPATGKVTHICGAQGGIFVAFADTQIGFSIWWVERLKNGRHVWHPVLQQGAYRHSANAAVAAMTAIDDLVYIGTAATNSVEGFVSAHGPELLRIDAPDSWEIVVGEPRFTPEGLKVPTSSMSAGFGDVGNSAITWIDQDGTMLIAARQSYIPGHDDSESIVAQYGGPPSLFTTHDDETWHQQAAAQSRRLNNPYAFSIRDGVLAIADMSDRNAKSRADGTLTRLVNLDLS